MLALVCLSVYLFDLNIFYFIYMNRDWAEHRCYVKALSCLSVCLLATLLTDFEENFQGRSEMTQGSIDEILAIIRIINH